MIRFLLPDHPLQTIDSLLRSRMERAQENLLPLHIHSAGELCEQTFADLRIDFAVPAALYNEPLSVVTEQSFGQLVKFFETLLIGADFPEQTIPLHAVNLSQRTQLIQAFDAPDLVIRAVENRVSKIVDEFPRKASHIERGKNPGDVLDPYILAATQYLICGGNFEQAIEATVAHKALMMIEGLIGHLHEDVIGFMRGNVRAPEPRGADQETLDPLLNPFPGADVVQPPWSKDQPVRFHQLKSKTGSAKGGDGKRLGEQLLRLQQIYGGEIYYHALIGNTLVGHRSKAGVEKAAPSVIVLVGEPSFYVLTGSEMGPQLLLRVYQTAFTDIARKAGYSLETLATGIVSTFKERAAAAGDGFLEVILKTATKGAPEQQDSRLFNMLQGRRGKRTVDAEQVTFLDELGEA